MALTPKKRKYVNKTELPYEIDISQLLLHSRQLYITGVINEKTVQPVINSLMGLQLVSDDPIVLWVNSLGGSMPDGFALIDAIKMSKVPVYTIIRGWACSMGAKIAVAGHRRLMTENSKWMIHDIAAGGYDYGDKVIAHLEAVKLWQKQCFDYLAEHTKLTPQELEQARHSELWLSPQQCLEKGVVDQIFKTERKTT